MKKYYDILGLSEGASKEEIQEAYDRLSKQLEPQKLIRKVSTPVDDENQFQTLPGATGILVNGVELLNYKSGNNIFYGPIEEISVTSPGSGYDIINPPVLQISDAVGSGATAYCNVKGSLDRIDIVDGGFDYLRLGSALAEKLCDGLTIAVAGQMA